MSYPPQGVVAGDMLKATYDPDKDGLIAVGQMEMTSDKVAVGQGLGSSAIEEDKPAEGDMGLSYKGTVTTYTDTTHFKDSGLAGYGDDFFKGYFVYVVRDAGGAGAAPQFEQVEVLDYTSTDGTFQHDAFTTPLAEDDEILVLLLPAAIGSTRASDNTIAEAPSERTQGGTPYTKVKEGRVPRTGSYRCKWQQKTNNATYPTVGKIYKNGGAVGVEKTSDTTSFVEMEDDIGSVVKGDLLQLYIQGPTGGATCTIKNFRICAEVSPYMGKITQD